MSTVDEITALSDAVETLTAPVVEWLISDIAQRIGVAGQLTSTAAYEVWRAQNLGLSLADVKKILRKKMKVTSSELQKLLTQATETGYDFNLSRLPTEKAIPFKENTSLQQIVNSTVKMVGEELENLTKTTGFVCPDGIPRMLEDAYRNACDYAFQKTVTGAQDYVSAIRDATRGLCEKGIFTIDYKSGKRRAVEVAVRQSVLGGIGLLAEEVNRQNHDDMGCDGWEISAHSASAPDHEPIQGKQYPDEEFTRLNNSLVRRIGTLGCGHIAFPIILGVNAPQYTPEELEQMRRENEEGITYNGQHYTRYKATQKQRKIERGIRRQKHRILVAEATKDVDKLQTAQIRYQLLDQEYKRFSKAADLRMQHERMEVAGFGPKQAREAQKNADDVFKNPPKDLKQLSTRVNKVLDQYCNRTSKWSGTTVVLTREQMPRANGRKEWNCDISLRDTAEIKTVIHEQLHARSVSYFDPDTYSRHKEAEEGTVELFAQEICKKNGVKFTAAYSQKVKPLQIINNILRNGDRYSFAKQLFDISLPERYNWLRTQANELIATGKLSKKTVRSLNDAVEFFREKDVK